MFKFFFFRLGLFVLVGIVSVAMYNTLVEIAMPFESIVS
jgi:hypothetical protein